MVKTLLKSADSRKSADNAAPCPLCGRLLLAGPLTTLHHLVPRSEGGTETVALHRICHQAIHAMLSERELAENYFSIQRLLEHPDLVRFVHWVKKRPPEFDDRTRWTRNRRGNS